MPDDLDTIWLVDGGDFQLVSFRLIVICVLLVLAPRHLILRFSGSEALFHVNIVS